MPSRRKKTTRSIIFPILLIVFTGVVIKRGLTANKSLLSLVRNEGSSYTKGDKFYNLEPLSTPTPSPTPTPRPLTFAELNELYGPCLYAPSLMYHHVQSQEQAQAEGNLSLTVFPDTFRLQMQHLADRGYTPISMAELNNFLQTGQKPAAKPIIITFDDGYDDNYQEAFPILKEFGFPATVFLATGLMENPGYLTWAQIQEMSGSKILFANHTWSHANVGGTREKIQKEIGTADIQLADHGQNTPKVFSYPYGFGGKYAKEFLSEKGYNLAFTTRSGSAQCRQQNLNLPRIRIGNTSLAAYGF